MAGVGWSLLAFIGGVVFLFQFLWGFNYGRIPLEEQLELDVKPLSVKELKAELDLAIEGMNTFRPMLEGVGEEAIGRTFCPNIWSTICANC